VKLTCMNDITSMMCNRWPHNVSGNSVAKNVKNAQIKWLGITNRFDSALTLSIRKINTITSKTD